MSQKNIIIAVVVVILLVGAAKVFHLKGRLLGGSNSGTTPTVTTSPSPSASPSAASASGTLNQIVKITSSGFSPSSVTIPMGGTITFTNTDSANHQIQSNPHPTHTDYPPLNLGVIAPGESKSLTFPTAGTYGYHDHLNPTTKGTIVVTQ